MNEKRLRMGTPTELKRTANKVANLLLNGEIDSKTANALLYSCNVIAGIIRIDEQEKKLAELEQAVKEIESGHKTY